MEIKVLKTFEISEDLWKQIMNGFNESFGTDACIDDLKNGFAPDLKSRQ